MPVHEVGYRPWKGTKTSPWFRWMIISKTGIRLAMKSSWVRRILFAAWLPLMYWSVGFFMIEKSLEKDTSILGNAIGEQIESIPRYGSVGPTINKLKRISASDSAKGQLAVQSLAHDGIFSLPTVGGDHVFSWHGCAVVDRSRHPLASVLDVFLSADRQARIHLRQTHGASGFHWQYRDFTCTGHVCLCSFHVPRLLSTLQHLGHPTAYPRGVGRCDRADCIAGARTIITHPRNSIRQLFLVRSLGTRAWNLPRRSVCHCDRNAGKPTG